MNNISLGEALICAKRDEFNEALLKAQLELIHRLHQEVADWAGMLGQPPIWDARPNGEAPFRISWAAYAVRKLTKA